MLTKKKGEAIGDCDGRMYPLSRFPFRKLSNLICSAGVRLYVVMKDFRINVSFSSILWSHDQGSRNRAALFSEKTSKNS